VDQHWIAAKIARQTPAWSQLRSYRTPMVSDGRIGWNRSGPGVVHHDVNANLDALIADENRPPGD
jgi:hypothetical protein